MSQNEPAERPARAAALGRERRAGVRARATTPPREGARQTRGASSVQRRRSPMRGRASRASFSTKRVTCPVGVRLDPPAARGIVDLEQRHRAEHAVLPAIAARAPRDRIGKRVSVQHERRAVDEPPRASASAPPVPSGSARPTTSSADAARAALAERLRARCSAPCPAHSTTVDARRGAASHSSCRRRNGRPPIGASGFGRSPNCGRSRVPSPPASTNAFTPRPVRIVARAHGIVGARADWCAIISPSRPMSMNWMPSSTSAGAEQHERAHSHAAHPAATANEPHGRCTDAEPARNTSPMRPKTCSGLSAEVEMNAAAIRSRKPLMNRAAPNLLRPNRRARWFTGTSPDAEAAPVRERRQEAVAARRRLRALRSPRAGRA